MANMARKKTDLSVECRQLLEEMMGDLNGGCQPDEFARDLLWAAKKSLVHCGKQEERTRKRNRASENGNRMVQLGSDSSESEKDLGPSRCPPDVKSIHFLRPEQVQNVEKIGKEFEEDVYMCHILDCPLIPKSAILVAKRFKIGDDHKMPAEALQEVLMGGLNRKGIVGALAMTVEDPPRFLYDYYNGRDLGSFVDKCTESSQGIGKSNDASIDFKFILQKKVFLENRLGIALALLETMQYLHDQDRVYCNLHEGNILLHFEYQGSGGARVYVGICDFKMSKHLSQSHLKEQQMWAIPDYKVAKYLKNYPQLAPELLGPNPLPFSKETDIYSMGNIFETLLQAEDDWDGMSKSTRYLAIGWNAMRNGKVLDEMIGAMMDINPKNRMDCSHWIQKMTTAFPDCQLRRRNSLYLRN